MATEVIRHSDGRIDAERLRGYVVAYQSVSPLTIGELWAWPSLLKAGLISYVSELSDGIRHARDEVARADAYLAALDARGSLTSPPPLGRDEQLPVRRAAAAAHPRVRAACGLGAQRPRRLARRPADDAGRRDPRRGAARGGRPGVDGQCHHEPALLRHPRLEPVRRVGLSGRGDPPPRPRRRVWPDGLREPRSLPPVARGARRRHRRGAGARRASERRGRPPLRCAPAERARRARRLLPDRPGARLSRAEAGPPRRPARPPQAPAVSSPDARLPRGDRDRHRDPRRAGGGLRARLGRLAGDPA